MTTLLEKFDIRNFIARLTPAKVKNRYICPVCSGNNLTISPKTGEYQCWNGCPCKEIREAVSPLCGNPSELSSTATPTSRYYSRQDQPPTPAPIPEGNIELAKLPEPVEYPAHQKRGEWTVIEYPYSDTQSVRRTEKPNPEKPKGYEKKTIPYHINAEGELISGKGDAAWNPYRLEEVSVHSSTKWVLGVEGESCVEAARFLKLVGFTLQGSTWTDGDLTRAMLQIKSTGARGIAYYPDHDETGKKKARAMATAAAKAQVPFIQIDPILLWSDCPEKGDIADWVEWGMDEGWNKEEFVRQLEKAFNAAADSAREEQYDTEAPPSAERLKAEETLDEWDDIPNTEITQKALSFLYGDKHWICVDGKLYCWTGTHYQISEDGLEEKRIADVCNAYPMTDKQGNIRFPYAKPSKVEEIIRWVKKRLFVSSKLVNPPGLNCLNGVLRIHWDVVNGVPTWELIPHDPSQYYTYEPMVTYNPEANPEACDRMLAALDAPQQDIFLKTIGASLDLATVRKYKGRLVRALLLKGDGSNGKDTLREAVSAMYGYQGMTGKTLTDFAAYDQGRKFPLAALKYSRVNWASENANTTRLDKIQSLKAFITGEYLDSERKGKDEDPFKSKGIALFNVNDTPNLQGTLEAIKGRYGVLLFNKTFKIGANNTKGELEAEPRFKDDPEFLKTEVLPAFLNRVLDALKRLMSEGIDYGCTEKALEDIQAENSHLFQFCQDVGLGYDAKGTLTATDIWTSLEQWYLDNGTLVYEEGANGKPKAIWAEQSKPSDRNVKAVNQVIARFRAIFPKTKLVTVPHESGKKNLQALQGIAFICDNNPEPPLLQFHPNSTPIPPQSPPQKNTENQGFHPTHPNVLTPEEKVKNPVIDPCNVSQEISATSQQLGWVGCDDSKSSLLGVDDGGGTGVETPEIGVGEQATFTPICFHDIIAKIDVELERLGWTKQEGREYLIRTYGKHSRQLLSDAELMEFFAYLESQPTTEQAHIESTAGDLAIAPTAAPATETNEVAQPELPIYQRSDGGFQVADVDLWLNEETIQDIIGHLERCEDRETLAELRKTWTSEAAKKAMNLACKQLSAEKYAQIKQWVVG